MLQTCITLGWISLASTKFSDFGMPAFSTIKVQRNIAGIDLVSYGFLKNVFLCSYLENNLFAMVQNTLIEQSCISIYQQINGYAIKEVN